MLKYNGPIRVSTNKVDLSDGLLIAPPPEKIKTSVFYYPNGRIKSVQHTCRGVLHHYFKPALSYYKNDINNSLVVEYFYEHGRPSKNITGKYKIIYNTL